MTEEEANVPDETEQTETNSEKTNQGKGNNDNNNNNHKDNDNKKNDKGAMSGTLGLSNIERFAANKDNDNSNSNKDKDKSNNGVGNTKENENGTEGHTSDDLSIGVGLEVDQIPDYLIDPQSKVTYTYDAVGNRLSMTDDTGTVYYTYNDANQITKAGDTEYTYDDNGNMVKKTNGETEVAYNYNGANQLTAVLYPDYTYALYSYDALRRKIYREEANIHIGELEKQSNGQGQEKSNNASSQGQSNGNNGKSDSDKNKSNDNKSNYSKTNYGKTNNGKSDNGKGNNDKDTGKTNAINNGNGKKNGLYKQLGEEWIQEIDNLDIDKTTYQYMGLSNTVHKEYSDKGSPYAEYYMGPNNTVVSRKMFGLHELINEAKEPDLKTTGGMLYYHYTGLNTVSEISDRHGEIIEHYRYDAFGNIFTGITAPYNTTSYTSHEYDDKSGFIYMNARWYNANIGRFITEDTYQGTLTEPLTQNRYAYVLNNPINLFDPTGYSAEAGTGGGVGGGTETSLDWVGDDYHYESHIEGDVFIAEKWYLEGYDFVPYDWELTNREIIGEMTYSYYERIINEFFTYRHQTTKTKMVVDPITGEQYERNLGTTENDETYMITNLYEWTDAIPTRLADLYDYENPPENMDGLQPKYTSKSRLGTNLLLSGDVANASDAILRAELDGVLGNPLLNYDYFDSLNPNSPLYMQRIHSQGKSLENVEALYNFLIGDDINELLDDDLGFKDVLAGIGFIPAGKVTKIAKVPFIDEAIEKGIKKADNIFPEGAGSGIKTNFVVTPNGEAIPIPKGATGPVDVVNPAGKTTGFGYTGGSGGANGQVSNVRIMDPTPPRGNSPGYPNGYVKYENTNLQGVDPITGRTLPNSQSHIPLK